MLDTGPLLLLLTVIPLFTLGILNILPAFNVRPRPSTRKVGGPTRLLIVLGSGGHTAEMLALLRNIDVLKYTHRSYVISSGDTFSAKKADAFEGELKKQLEASMARSSALWKHPHPDYKNYDIATVPRARRVHQSLLTTPFTSLRCFWSCLLVLHGHHVYPRIPGPRTSHPDDPVYPDLIVMNGPGTAVIMTLASLFIRFLSLPGARGKMRTIYVESWARVRRLSLSGKLVLNIVDRYIVQWETLLAATGPKGEYKGILI